MDPLNSVSVFGLGKLGACIAATLAARGFRVLGVDTDPEKVQRLSAGEPPVDEPGLAPMIRENRARLSASGAPEDAVETDVSFYIPPSPSLPDGSFATEYLVRAMRPMARVIREAGKKAHLFVVSSTTTPGAMRGVIVPMLEEETGWTAGAGLGVCYNPEFIALGNVIRGLLEPDLVLIGESDPASGDRLQDLYRRYNTNQPFVARMSMTSAELAKISVNSYITMKISFTNQLRLLAEKLPDADIRDILDAVGQDHRIGADYLKPGLSYGGPCFPRDNRLVAYAARQVGLEAPLAEAADRVNELTKHQLVERARTLVQPGDAVAVLGMAYRPDTYIVEESAGLYLAQQLKALGHRVWIHDFLATPDNSPGLAGFDILSAPADLMRHPDVKLAVVCCPCSGYRDLQVPPAVRVLDPWGLLRGPTDR